MQPAAAESGGKVRAYIKRKKKRKKRVCRPKPMPANPDMLTVSDFCSQHRISKAFYYRLKRENRGPRETKINSKTLITKENAADWREQLQAAE